MKGSGKNKIVIFAVVILAALAIAAAIKLSGGTDARQAYFKAESSNLQKFLRFIDDSYNTFKNSSQPYIDSAYRRRTEYTADINSDGKPFGMKNAGRLFDVIKDSKLIVDTRRKPAEDQAVSDISLLVEKAPFIETEVSTVNGRLNFTVPVLLPERYFSAELDKLDEVYDKFSLPVRPERLVNSADIYKALEYDKNSLNDAVKKAGEIFSKAIIEDAVSFGDKKEITIDGRTVKGKEIVVSLNNRSANALLRELSSFVAGNEVLIPYTYGNYSNITEILDDAGLFRLFEYLHEADVVILNDNEKALVNELSMKKDIKKFADQLKKTLNMYTFRNGLQMTVFLDHSGNIVSRELSFDIAAEEESKAFKLELKSGSNKLMENSCIDRYFDIVITQPEKTTKINYVPELEMTDENGMHGSVALSYKVTQAGKEESSVDIKLDISGGTDQKTLKKNKLVKFDVQIYGSEGDGVLQGEIDRTTWSNKKLRTLNSTTKINVQADLPTFGIKDLIAVVSIKGEDTINIEEFSVPDMTGKTITDLNKVSGSDLDRLKAETLASFGSFYITNKTIFDAILNQ